MTIHRALAELKTLDARISRAIEELEVTGVAQKGKPILAATGRVYQSEEDFVKAAKSSRDSVNALIRNKSTIKRAIVESNSKTMVTINGQEMSVADAITKKSHLSLQHDLLNRIVALARKSEGTVKTSNEKVEASLQQLLIANFGKETKPTPDQVETVSKPYRDMNEVHPVDPLKSSELIAKMRSDIDGFTTEVDAVLSESNAVTTVEVELA